VHDDQSKRQEPLHGTFWKNRSGANRSDPALKSLYRANLQAQIRKKDSREAMERGAFPKFEWNPKDWEIMRRYEKRNTIIGQATKLKTGDFIV
jgi:hypothetical protein